MVNFIDILNHIIKFCFTVYCYKILWLIFLILQIFITIIPIDLSCKVTSTTSNEIITSQPTEVTSTTSNEDSPHNHQTGINTNLTTYAMYQNRLIKIQTGLLLQQPVVRLWSYNEFISAIRNKPSNTKSSSLGLYQITRSKL